MKNIYLNLDYIASFFLHFYYDKASQIKIAVLCFHIDWKRCCIFLHFQILWVFVRILNEIPILIFFSTPCIENCIIILGFFIQFGCRKIYEQIKKRSLFIS